MSLISKLILGGAVLLGIGAAIKQTARNNAREKEAERILAEQPDSADLPGMPEVPPPVRAKIIRIRRDMNPLSLTSGVLATFCTEDDREYTLPVSSEAAEHILEGDEGMLTVGSGVLISFEMDNGDVIGSLFYMPAEVEHE